MSKYIKQSPKRTTEIESLHTPRLFGWTTLDRETGMQNPLISFSQIVSFDGEIWHRRPRSALAKLICGVMLLSAAKVTIPPISITMVVPRIS
jgi:hypothetical protein